jgi:hypothetical protein
VIGSEGPSQVISICTCYLNNELPLNILPQARGVLGQEVLVGVRRGCPVVDRASFLGGGSNLLLHRIFTSSLAKSLREQV